MAYLPRGIEQRLRLQLSVDPLVILEGARATGKTSLLEHAVEQQWISEIRTFAEASQADAAAQAPQEYIGSLRAGTAIDEAQLVESVTLAIKSRIDTDTTPGQLILTGSTRLRRNALGGSDPFAGRVGAPLMLRPLTISERAGVPFNLLAELFDGDPRELELGPPISRSGLRELVAHTGLPGLFEMSLGDQVARADSYVSSITNLQIFESRKVRNVGSLARFLAARTSTPVNISEFHRAVGISRPTVDEYLCQLEEALLIHRLPAWRVSKDKSEISTAKLHFFDSGVAAALGRLSPDASAQDLGRLVETFVVGELMAQSEWLDQPPKLYHWRFKNTHEVDVVAEQRDGRTVSVEVKSAEKVDVSDFGGINKFRELHGSSNNRGFVFYAGESVLPFGEDRWAVPFSALRPSVITPPDDMVGDVLETIAAHRGRSRSNRSRMDRRVEEFTTEILAQLNRLAEELDDLPVEIRSAEPAPKWHASLLVRRPKQDVALLDIRLTLHLELLAVSVLVPNSSKHLRFSVETDDRDAAGVVGELFTRSQAGLIAALDVWDEEDHRL